MLTSKVLKKLLFILLTLFYLSQIGLAGEQIVLKPDGSNSNQNQINDALKQAATQAEGISIFLTAGVYTVDNTITIQSSIRLTGDSNAIVKVYSGPGAKQWYTGTNSIITSLYNDDIEISGFQIDGSCSSLPFEYHHSRSDTAHDCERAILIAGQTNKFCKNIVVHDMQIYDCFSDGIHIRFANNVHCYSNFISNCQHEGIFWTCVVNGLAEANKIAGITSDCMRCDNCVTFLVKNNYFYSYTGNNNSQAPKGEQNGIQVADAGASKGYDASNKPLSTKDGEITGNTFANTGEKAVWLDSTGKGYDNVYIHDNRFINVNVFTNSGHSVSVNITAINASVPTYQNTTGAIIPTKENSELIFSSIFNILNTEFVDNATTKQTADDFNYQIQETEQGKIAGGIKIVGFNSLIKIENQTYISSPDDVIVKTSIIKNPSLEAWNGGLQNIDKDVNVTFKNGTVYATLTAKVKWYNLKKTPNGEEIKKYKTSEYIFTDTYSPAPEILKQPENITGIIYQYPTYFTLKVPPSGLTKVSYEYEGEKSEHTLLVGSKNITNGTTLIEYSELEYWKGDLKQQADWVQIPGKLKQNELNVTAYTPYKEIEVKDFKIIKKEVKEDPIAWWFKPSVGLLAILLVYLKRNWDGFRKT